MRRIRLALGCSVLAVLLMSSSPQNNSGMVSSSSAAYDGNALVLSGQVVLDHGLGTMQAEQAILEKQEGAGKEFPFSSILLKNNVQLLLPEEASLQCESATLDFTTLIGKLSSSQERKVVYSDVLKRKSGKPIALSISSLESELFFEKHEHSGQRSDFAIKTAQASGDVVVDYGTLFTLKAGKAIYQKTSSQSELTQGTLQAFPSEEFRFCRIEHGHDAIDAEAIEVDLAHTAIVFKNAHGKLTTAVIPKLQQGEIHFHSDQILWDQPQNSFHLRGNVSIDESALGSLSTDNELVIIQGKTGVSSMYSLGSTLLQFQETQSASRHQLMCHGKMLIDHEKMQAVFESPLIDGQIPSDSQLYYEEGKISIYADRAHIDYAAEGAKLRPSTIVLKGNVRVRSIDAERPTRFGISDWVTYSPTTRTFILGAHPGSRVLFFDEKDNLRISAQEIHLTQDGSGPETVKGVGNVQFSFSAEEETFLKSIFGIVN